MIAKIIIGAKIHDIVAAPLFVVVGAQVGISVCKLTPIMNNIVSYNNYDHKDPPGGEAVAQGIIIGSLRWSHTSTATI